MQREPFFQVRGVGGQAAGQQAAQHRVHVRIRVAAMAARIAIAAGKVLLEAREAGAAGRFQRRPQRRAGGRHFADEVAQRGGAPVIAGTIVGVLGHGKALPGGSGCLGGTGRGSLVAPGQLAYLGLRIGLLAQVRGHVVERTGQVARAQA